MCVKFAIHSGAAKLDTWRVWWRWGSGAPRRPRTHGRSAGVALGASFGGGADGVPPAGRGGGGERRGWCAARAPRCCRVCGQTDKDVEKIN